MSRSRRDASETEVVVFGRHAVFEALAGQYFDRAFRKMVQAFEDRADALYGRENAAANL